MKLTVIKNLNVRVGAASLNAPCYQYIAPGSILEVDGKLYKGDSYEGVNIWYKDGAGNYYWSGGVTEEAAPSIAAIKGEIPWWVEALQIPSVWNTYNEKGANAKVAVLDSGYNTANSELQAGVVADYLTFQDDAGTITIKDEYGHGSMCTSLIGARNTAYTVGCAPECKLYIAKISDQGSLSYDLLKNGIKWAVLQKVDIISISYGGDTPDKELEDLIEDTVTKKQIIVVASIGNNDPENGADGGSYPALYKNVIAVGATDKNKNLSQITMRNNKTEINAPGEDIYAYLDKTDVPVITPHGTSQATAIVAGICALIISRYKALGKPYTTDSIKNLLATQFDPVTGSAGNKLIAPQKIFQVI